MERIQKADDQTKKRWLIATSIVIMIIVVYVWLGYFNSLVAIPSAAQTEAPEKFSFLSTLKIGAGVAWDKLIASLHGFGDILSAPRKYIIKPQ